MPEPFFLLGTERAGLALLELALAGHPGIAWGGALDAALADPAPGSVRLAHARLAQQRAGGGRSLGTVAHAHYDRLVQLWPDARFVHLARTPSRGDRLARREADLLRASNLAWRGLAVKIPAQNRLELRHEVLVTSPTRELARLCDFLSVGSRLPVDPRATAADRARTRRVAPGLRAFALALQRTLRRQIR